MKQNILLVISIIFIILLSSIIITKQHLSLKTANKKISILTDSIIQLTSQIEYLNRNNQILAVISYKYANLLGDLSTTLAKYSYIIGDAWNLLGTIASAAQRYRIAKIIKEKYPLAILVYYNYDEGELIEFLSNR